MAVLRSEAASNNKADRGTMLDSMQNEQTNEASKTLRGSSEKSGELWGKWTSSGLKGQFEQVGQG